MVTAIRSAKKEFRTPRYIISRAYKDINWDEMKRQISSDYRLGLVMTLNDSDKISLLITETITDHLNHWAPAKRIQVRTKQAILSNETKQLIQSRDQEWTTYMSQPTMDNARSYKHLKNLVKKSIKKDKENTDKRNVAEASKSRDYWKHGKKLIGWTTYAGSKLLIKDGKLLNSPKEMADELNLDYIVRANRASKNTPPPVQWTL